MVFDSGINYSGVIDEAANRSMVRRAWSSIVRAGLAIAVLCFFPATGAFAGQLKITAAEDVSGVTLTPFVEKKALVPLICGETGQKTRKPACW